MKIKVLRFTFLCFLPMICVFVSPLIFYNLPIAVRVDEVAIELTVFEIFYATFVWIVWVLVAGAIVIVGQNKHDSGPHWDIHERGLWWSFIICGTLGSCIAIVHQLVQFPRGFENLIHILAFSPMIALIFGMYLLCWKNLRSKQRFLVAFLCIPSVLAAFCLPLILGYVNPMVISALGILYALSAMAIRWRIQVGALGFFVLLIGISLAYKSDLRTMLYGGALERNTSLVEWYGQKTNPRQNLPDLVTLRRQSVKNSLEDKMKEIGKLILPMIKYDTEVALATEKGFDFETAQLLASKGNSIAMLFLGKLAEDSKNYGKAENWYLRASAHGNSSAMLRLAYLYQDVDGVSGNLDQIRNWYEKAAQRGNSMAMHILSLMYLTGSGIVQDYSLAVKWESRAIGVSLSMLDDLDQKNTLAKAMRALGNLYERGEKVGKDLTRANQWHQHAARLGYLAKSVRALGNLYERGEKVGKDLTQASQWYQHAARFGDVVALRKVIVMYEDGYGTSFYFEKQIECCFPDELYSDAQIVRIIGRLYETGHGLPRDYVQARVWYSRAVSLNDADAMRRLAAIYEQGLGISKDHTRAEALYKQANIIDPVKSVNVKEQFKEYDPNYFKLRWYGDSRDSEFYLRFDRIAHRLNSLGNLAYVIRMTPDKVPYSYWETYEPLFYSWIPRILWKDKPIEKTGILIGQKYGYSKPSDKPFVWSMPSIFESWMAFGWLGVLGTAVVVGTLLRLAWNYLVRNSSSPGGIVFGVIIVTSTAHLAMSSLNLVIGGMLHNLLLYWLLIVLVRKIWVPQYT